MSIFLNGVQLFRQQLLDHHAFVVMEKPWSRDCEIALINPSLEETYAIPSIACQLRDADPGIRINVFCPYLPYSADKRLHMLTRSFFDVIHVSGVKQVKTWNVPDHANSLSRTIREIPIDQIFKDSDKTELDAIRSYSRIVAVSFDDVPFAARVAEFFDLGFAILQDSGILLEEEAGDPTDDLIFTRFLNTRTYNRISLYRTDVMSLVNLMPSSHIHLSTVFTMLPVAHGKMVLREI